MEQAAQARIEAARLNRVATGDECRSAG